MSVTATTASQPRRRQLSRSIPGATPLDRGLIALVAFALLCLTATVIAGRDTGVIAPIASILAGALVGKQIPVNR